MDGSTLGYLALIVMGLKLLGIVDRWAHALGMTKVMDAQLRHFAAIPGNKAAPIANAIADAIEAGKDQKLIDDATNLAGSLQGVKTLGAAMAEITKDDLPPSLKAG